MYNSDHVGSFSEQAALVWLKANYPIITWIPTKRDSIKDKHGVDIIGYPKKGSPIEVQVKSSVEFAEKFYRHSQDESIRILIIEQNKEAIHWLD